MAGNGGFSRMRMDPLFSDDTVTVMGGFSFR